MAEAGLPACDPAATTYRNGDCVPQCGASQSTPSGGSRSVAEAG